MSLIKFHRFLISAAILFCAGYAFYEGRAALGLARDGSLPLAVVFSILAVGLSIYLWQLPRFLKSKER